MYLLPSSLNQKQLDTFKQIYKEQYAEEISDAQAQDLGLELIEFIAHILLTHS